MLCYLSFHLLLIHSNYSHPQTAFLTFQCFKYHPTTLFPSFSLFLSSLLSTFSWFVSFFSALSCVGTFSEHQPQTNGSPALTVAFTTALLSCFLVTFCIQMPYWATLRWGASSVRKQPSRPQPDRSILRKTRRLRGSLAATQKNPWPQPVLKMICFRKQNIRNEKRPEPPPPRLKWTHNHSWDYDTPS